MRKRICGFLLGVLCTAVLTGCGLAGKTDLQNTELEKVELVVWGAQEDTELMNQIIQSFEANYQGHTPLGEAFGQVGRRTEGVLGELFRGTEERIGRGQGELFAVIWQEEVENRKKDMFLSDREIRELCAFGADIL